MRNELLNSCLEGSLSHLDLNLGQAEVFDTDLGSPW